MDSSESTASADGLPAVAVRGLVKRYGGRAVVDDISFAVPPGEVFALLGPNGAGKTTTVETLEGYRRPDAGDVRVLGLDPARDLRRLRARTGLMLQQGGVYPQITPIEALRLFAAFYPEPDDPQAWLHRVGLVDVAHTRYRHLSGGQKQRLSLALALVGRPELVFLDEPTVGMDPQARQSTWQIIRDLRGQGVTVLLTTHFMDEAEELADRVAIVHHGRLVALDTPTGLRRSVGGELRLTTSAPVDPAAVALALELPTTAVGVDQRGRLTIAVEPTPALVAHLASWLADRHVLLLELHAGSRSLEQAFLAITAGEETGAG